MSADIAPNVSRSAAPSESQPRLSIIVVLLVVCTPLNTRLCGPMRSRGQTSRNVLVEEIRIHRSNVVHADPQSIEMSVHRGRCAVGIVALDRGDDRRVLLDDAR